MFKSQLATACVVIFRSGLDKVAASDLSGPVLQGFPPLYTVKKLVNRCGI
jgi:hypothetical protein